MLPSRAAVLLLCLVVSGLGAARRAEASAPETDPNRRSLVVRAVERASPAVVNISTAQVIERRGAPFPFPSDPFFEEFFRDFFDPRPRRETRTSLGSGVIVRPDGTILTNEHVILRGSRIHVTLVDGREYEARLVGSDADSDLAVLRLQGGRDFPTVALGRSDDLLIGETVIAIGNPFGFSHTVTTGVVSAVGRSLRGGERTFTDFIQTDAAINPGNSGGPLLNINGELIGINTAIYGKAQGIGFAIPVDRAKRILRDLVSYGEVRRGWVGLAVQPLTPDLQRYFQVRSGVVVSEVEPGSPAERASIARGDVVTQVDGQPIGSPDEFETRVEDRGPGDRVRLRVLREEGDEREVTVVLADLPGGDVETLAWERIGIRVAEDAEGLVVTAVRRGSPAARIGVERGDRILGLGGAPVTTRSELRRQLMNTRRARSVLLSVGRGPYQYNVPLVLAPTG